MNLLTLHAFTLDMTATHRFRHTAMAGTCTQSVWVKIEDGAGNRGYGEACPRESATGESLSSALAYIETWEPVWCANIHDLAALRAWVDVHRLAIDATPAAWCAVELAFLDLFARREGITVEALLGLDPLAGECTYTAVLGDASPPVFEASLAHAVAAGFERYKIQIVGRSAHDRAKVVALRNAGVVPAQVRADTTNLFANARDAVRYLDHLDFPFGALEAPVQPTDLLGLRAVARACDCAIVLDEILACGTAIERLPADVSWMVNVQLSKMGGLLRSITIANKAVTYGHGVLVGAHFSATTVLSRAALTLAQSCRKALLEQRGELVKHLLQHDVVPDSFASGAGARYAINVVPGGPGLGVERVAVSTAYCMSSTALFDGHDAGLRPTRQG